MKVSIIGAAGNVGSCAAFAIANQGLVDEIVMQGMKQNIIINHTMDIQAAMTGRKDIIVRFGTYEDMSDSDIVIIAAGVHFPVSAPVPEKLVPNIPIMKNISAGIERYCPGAIVITVTNPVDLMNYAVYVSSSFDRKQLIGLNLNDSIRFRMAIAKALGLSPFRVEGLVMGAHPESPLVVFSSVKVDGKQFSLNETDRQKVRTEINNYLRAFEALKAGRSAGWTTAVSIAAMVQAILEDSGKILACSAILEGEYGYKGLSIGVPAIIGKKGIREILELEMTELERGEMDNITKVMLENSVLVRRLSGSDRL
jgi:malate dehydrogenase